MIRKVYLRQNVLVEPLINQWYAWSYLIPPPTAAMYIANSQVKIMQSFIAAPESHITALKNPAMISGPFINYDASRVEEIKVLMEKTVKGQAHMLEFAKAVKALDEMLMNEAEGHSLEPMYQKIPDILRGYVELVYDLNNNPSIRFIEGLLYNSPFYNESSQSLALSLIEKDYRPFVFSTPRLAEDNILSLNKSYRYEGIDELFKMKTAANYYDRIKEILEISNEDDDLFSSFFTEDPPSHSRYIDDDVRIRYFGHACLLIETSGISILTDPVISYQYDTGISRYTYSDLPDSIDYVLITHNHQDHCLFESLLQLRDKIRTLIIPRSAGGLLTDPSFRLLLQQTGFKNIVEIDEMGTIEIEYGSIAGLPFLGEHADLNVRSKIAYLVTLKGKSILCAADSNNIEPRLYEIVHELVGDVDIIFLGMECVGGPLSWLYGPLMTRPIARKMDQSRRFDGSNCEKAVGIVTLLNPTQVYVYAMGHEPWLSFLTSLQYSAESRQIVESNRLIEECRNRGMVSERLYCQKEILLGNS